ncbi:30S ribosomal protein S15, partial [Melia azedarach]
GTSGNRSSGDGAGPVAQRIRARGYEPRCRGFESLLAHNLPFWEGPFPKGGRKIMIGIADPKLWNLGVGLLSKWSSLTFSFFFISH